MPQRSDRAEANEKVLSDIIELVYANAQSRMKNLAYGKVVLSFVWEDGYIRLVDFEEKTTMKPKR